MSSACAALSCVSSVGVVCSVTESPVPVADELDTDLETDRLLGQQRTDDHGFYEDKVMLRTYLSFFLSWQKISIVICLTNLHTDLSLTL